MCMMKEPLMDIGLDLMDAGLNQIRLVIQSGLNKGSL